MGANNVTIIIQLNYVFQMIIPQYCTNNKIVSFMWFVVQLL